MSEAEARIGGDEYLVLLGGDAPNAPLGWFRFSANRNEELARGRTSAGAFTGATPARTILVIPAADAQIKRLEIAAQTEAQARAAAPYLFDGALAAPSQALHYAIGAAQDANGARLVAAIASSRLNEWIEACRAVGAEPGAAMLDCTIWPASAGAVEIVETAQFTIVAGGKEGGFSIEPALAPSLFARWLAQARERVGAIHLSVADPTAWTHALGADSPPVVVGAVEDPGAAFARAALDAPDYAPNLRQGAFAPATGSTQPLRLWRFAAALALIALALQIGSLVAAGWRDAQAAQRTMALAERDFRAARPDVRRIVNLRAQAAALVNAMDRAGEHPVLAVTDPLIRVLQAHPLVRVDEVRHAAPDRAVHLRFSASQAEALEAAIADLKRQGLQAESRDLRPIEGRYTTEVVLETS